MNPPEHPPRLFLPHRRERIVWGNLLLLLGLPLLAHLVGLAAHPTSDKVNFPVEAAVATPAYLCLAIGGLLLYRRMVREERWRERLDRADSWIGRLGKRIVRFGRRRPTTAIWLAAAAGVLVSCYPVVFGGQSFVSPNLASQLFYGRHPSMPHTPSDRQESAQGSDVAAMFCAHLPYSVIESRAIFQDGELPVWNRYNAGGATLLGQGQSMLGDPLHGLVVAAGGSAGAWDLKFLLARLLFAAGIGLGVRAATGRTAAACLLAFGACFFGFFAYRLNHAGTFSLCYAPWVLLAWLRIVRGTDRPNQSPARAQLGRVALLLAACWLELNSGTAKEACLLLGSLNGVGVVLLLLDDRRSWRWKGRALAGLAWAGVGFVLVSAPLWRTFAEALAHSWNNYAKPQAWQLQPGLLIGLFDDIFYRQFNRNEHVLDPSANGLVLFGVACAVAAGGALLRRSRVFLALALGALPPLALVFGVVPPSLIKATPVLGNVIFVDNAFSCVLLVLLPTLAGIGLEHARTTLRAPDFAGRYVAVAAVPLLGLALFFGTTQASQRSNFSPLAPVGGELPLSPFFKGYVATLVAAWLVLPLLARWWVLRGRGAAWGTVPWAVLCLGALLWRGGLQEHALVEAAPYVPYVGLRVNLQPASAAVDRLRAAARVEPGRVLGFDNTLMSGYLAVFGLESPSGPDALQNAAYHELLARSGVPYFWNWYLATNRQTTAALPVRRFYDLLNVRYYADAPPPGSAAPAEVAGLRVLGRYDLDLYESPTAWPRAFFTDNVTLGNDLPDLFQALAQGDGRPFATISPAEILARPDAGHFEPLVRPPGGDGERTVIPATGYRLTSRTTSFHLHAPGPGVAVLMEAFQTPYNARVTLDGQAVTPFRVDEAFLGVLIPAVGEHEVRVVYGPRDLGSLFGLSTLGVALLAGTAWWVARSRRTVGRMPPMPALAHQPKAADEVDALA